MHEARSAGPWPEAEKLPRGSRFRWWPQVIAAACAICLLALFGRIMAYPLQHDEQFYIPAGALLPFYRLYEDLGFSHFPNLPLLLAGAYRLLGSDHYVLVGRLLLAGAWLAACVALFMIGREYARSKLVAALMVALLLFNSAFLEETGMAVTNNFIPIPFVLFAIFAFLKAAEGDRPRPSLAALSGLLFAVAAGFKANYLVLIPPFALASLLVPPGLPFSQRISRLALPMLAGGLVGGTPAIYFFLQDPAGFVAQTFSFHRGPQLAYWAAYPDPANPLSIGLRDKYLLASRIWFAGATLVLLMTVAVLAILRTRHRTFSYPAWPVVVVAGAATLAALASFAPTPAFPQYYTPAIPLGIVLLGLLYGNLDPRGRYVGQNLIIGALIVAPLIGAPMLLLGLPSLARPDRWTGIVVHDDSRRIAELVEGSGPVATLAPVFALEGRLPVYPELGLGPFVYRAANWIPARDQVHYRHLASPSTAASLFGSRRPAAMLVGFDEELEAPLVRFAASEGYARRSIALSRGRTAELFIEPPRERANAVAPDEAAPPEARAGVAPSAAAPEG